MIRNSYRCLLLTGVLALLPLAGSATAASPSATDFGIHKTTLTHTGVEQLIANGERVKVTSDQAIHWEVRLFVYQRALSRGGLKDPSYDPAGKTWISPNYHLVFTHPGSRWITLRVNNTDRDALLRSGTISEGYFSAGYRAG